MSEKKRKRQSEGGDRPSKKAITNGSSSSTMVKVTHIPKDDLLGPIIASTPGISVPSDLTFQTYRRRKVTTSKSKGDELLLRSSSHPRMNYTAREHQLGGAEDLLKHYVAIFDPQKGELQLIEARNMSVRSTLRSEEDQMQSEGQAERTGALSLRQELGMAFGTKKAKKAIASLSENAISPAKGTTAANKTDPAADAVLQSMAASAENAPSKAALQAEIDDAKPRPRHNPHAKKVEDVYPISSIVGDEVLNDVKVKPWVDAVEAGTHVETTSRFVSRRLEALVEADEIRRLKVLRYMLVLIKFSTALKKVKHGKKLPQKSELVQKMEVDISMVETVKKRFTDGNEMTKWHVDNLMTHLAVLSLIVDEFETDTHDLREDLGLNAKQMAQYFNEIGAKVYSLTDIERDKAGLSKQEATAHRVARLTLPLQFPRPKQIPTANRRAY